MTEVIFTVYTVV